MTTLLNGLRTRSPGMALIVLGIAIVAASFAANFMRLAQLDGLPSLVIVALRLLLASVLLAPLVLAQYGAELRRLTRQDWLFAALAGFWMATHFIFIVFALERTTVVVLQVLVGTGPLWVAMMEVTFLKARLHRLVWAGIFVAIFGSILIAWGGANGSDAAYPDALMGAALSLLGAVAGAIYLTLGRKVRAKVSNIPYVWIVFASAGLVSTIIVLLTGTPITGHPAQGYVWVVLLALIPQLIGHSGFNYAMGALSATLVTLTGQIVTVGAGVLAFLIFGQLPGSIELFGSAIVIGGVVLAILGQSRRKRKA